MEASESKWVNPVLNIIGVNLLRLRSLQIAKMKSNLNLLILTKKSMIKIFLTWNFSLSSSWGVRSRSWHSGRLRCCCHCCIGLRSRTTDDIWSITWWTTACTSCRIAITNSYCIRSDSWKLNKNLVINHIKKLIP